MAGSPAAGEDKARITEDREILHVLNRLTFGPRQQDVDQVRRMGLGKWIETQLHPEAIAENPLLEAKLAPLDTLRMSTRDIVAHYPAPQMVKAFAEGQLALPADPERRFLVQKLVARYERKEKGGPNAAPPGGRAVLDSLGLDDGQKDTLRWGTPEERSALLQVLPEEKQWELLDALPNGMRQRMFAGAPAGLRRKIQTLNGPLQVVIQDLTEGKLLRAVYSNRQLEEVLTDFWFNHFNVDVDKGADRFMVTAYERDAIRPHVLGRFEDLLLATAQSPAMLFYLDNFQSVAPDTRAIPNQNRLRGLNENYGRELMELHTLGVDGGYTQQDVTEVARCFTGWTIAQPQRGGGFVFNPRLHDRGEKHVLGVTIPAGGGIEDGLKALDILAHHPSTAHFISKSLATRFVADDPPKSLVKKMAATFTATDGDLREVMRTMIDSSEFRDPANFRSKVKSPLEMTASAIRALNGDIDFTFAMNGILTQMGEPLYRKLEPTGYSNRGADWMNSASLLARMNFAGALAQGKINGIRVDRSQFGGNAAEVERRILLTEASKDARDAIQAGLEQRGSAPFDGALVAGLTLGSPDFQKH
ncbi:MAG: DUF1800 domain-containing protein [Acidobacteriota bacterium]|nr:DUF1800 domain-containing protein [Acidobacteriota bacterium]